MASAGGIRIASARGIRMALELFITSEKTMQQLIRNIATNLLGTIFCIAFLVTLCITWPRKNSFPDLPFVIMWAAIAAGGVYWIIKMFPKWFVVLRKDIYFQSTITAKLPNKFNFTINISELEYGLLAIYFTNCSQDCVGRKIVFLPNGESPPQLIDECGEPKPGRGGNTNRGGLRWARGTGTSRSPLFYDWPRQDTIRTEGTVQLMLEWNFLGTYLEGTLPQNRVLEGEIILFRKGKRVQPAS